VSINFRKTLVIFACVGLSVGVLDELFGPVKPIWFWLALWLGFLIGYWIPPRERVISFRLYLIGSLLVSLVGSVLLGLVRAFV